MKKILGLVVFCCLGCQASQEIKPKPASNVRFKSEYVGETGESGFRTGDAIRKVYLIEIDKHKFLLVNGSNCCTITQIKD